MLLWYYIKHMSKAEKQLLDRIEELTDKHYNCGLTSKENEEFERLANQWEAEYNQKERDQI